MSISLSLPLTSFEMFPFEDKKLGNVIVTVIVGGSLEL